MNVTSEQNYWRTRATVILPDGRRHTTTRVNGYTCRATRAQARREAAATRAYVDPSRPQYRWTVRVLRDTSRADHPWVLVHLVYRVDGQAVGR